jgi:hypothetical protein
MSLLVEVFLMCKFDVSLYFFSPSLHFGYPTALKQLMIVMQGITARYLQQTSSCLRIIAGTPHLFYY